MEDRTDAAVAPHGSNVTDHWQDIYATRAHDSLSWFQNEPTTSLRLVEQFSTVESRIVDVGAGASQLAIRLLEHGYRDVTVLDLAHNVLEGVVDRAGTHVNHLSVVVGDVTRWRPERSYDLWHDRAVLHFLTVSEDQARYVSTASRCVVEGGVLVIGVFAEDGPESCSGLVVQRYSVAGLVQLFTGHFDMEHHEREVHSAPSGASQAFNWVVLRRRGS